MTPSNVDLGFTMRRLQFPIQLAFACTINKAQGQTLDHVGLFLPQPVPDGFLARKGEPFFAFAGEKGRKPVSFEL